MMKEAVVAIEDQRFYEHRGVDFQGIARARLAGRRSPARPQQGASTITQQFVKNALAAQDSRTVFQKLREAALAYHLERQWSKDKILTEYLNEIYFGEGATGIEAAAQDLLRLQPPRLRRERRRAEPCASRAAALGGGAARRDDLLAERLLAPRLPRERDRAPQPGARSKMREQGYITAEEYAEYAADPDPRRRARSTPPAENSAAPYFTSWLRQQLVDRYGAGEAFGGGLQIRSTLDLELQNQVEEIVASRRSAGIEPTASVVVLDNETGGVLAMVGGSDFQDAPFNLATNGHRQPGSSFKPFTLITALEQGHSTGEVFTSAPQEIPFRVKVRRRTATATKVVNDALQRQQLRRLLPRLGLDRDRDHLLRQLGLLAARHAGRASRTSPRPRTTMGIETDLVDRRLEYSIDDGAFAALQPGADPRRPRDRRHPAGDGPRLQHARRRRQAALRHDGRRAPAGPVGDPQGHRRRGRPDRPSGDAGRPTRPAPAARTRSSPSRWSTRRSPRPPRTCSRPWSPPAPASTPQTGEPTWGKTGTTDDNGDAWFCGATEEITACVWVGYRRHGRRRWRPSSPARPVDGGTFPALIFADDRQRLRGGRRRCARPARTRTTSSSSTTAPRPCPTPTTAVAPSRRPRRRRSSRAAPPSEEAAPAGRAGAAGGDGAPAAPRAGGGVSRRLSRPRSGRGRQRPRQVLAAGGAEAPRQLGRLGDPDPRARSRPRPRATRPRAAAARTAARSSEAPLSSRPIAERLGELARARAELARLARARAARRIRSIPRVGSSARISTAAALPSGSRRR